MVTPKSPINTISNVCPSSSAQSPHGLIPVTQANVKVCVTVLCSVEEAQQRRFPLWWQPEDCQTTQTMFVLLKAQQPETHRNRPQTKMSTNTKSTVGFLNQLLVVSWSLQQISALGFAPTTKQNKEVSVLLSVSRSFSFIYYITDKLLIGWFDLLHRARVVHPALFLG